MVTLNQYLADVHARGFRLLENPKYGGVNYGIHMKTSWHYKGRACDINWGPSGAPASERPQLIWAARLAEAAGLNAIYAYYRPHPNARTNANHRDHLHVDDSPVTQRALKPRYPGGNDALYRRILAERPLDTNAKRKPHTIATIGVRHNPSGTWREKLWQTFLIATKDLPKGSADGVFGPKTERATKEWQERARLKPDGVVGEHTWYRACMGVEPGRKGTRVKIAQRVMGLRGGGVDGKFGPSTEVRAKEVQRWLGVTADGNWGPKTIAALLKKG